MPWKNGLGSTTEIAIFPPIATLEAGDFHWRLSSATVSQDGPFSRFPGFERHLALVRGAGLTLKIDGRKTRVNGDEVARFSGSAKASGQLSNGPIVDLNLIVNEKLHSGMLGLFRDPFKEIKLVPGTTIILALTGLAQVHVSQEKAPICLKALETLLINTEAAGTATVSISNEARVALVQVTDRRSG